MFLNIIGTAGAGIEPVHALCLCVVDDCAFLIKEVRVVSDQKYTLLCSCGASA